MNTQIKLFARKLANPSAWAYVLFWSWNLVFLTFMALGFAPRILPEVLNAVRTHRVPASFLVYAVILTVIPAAAVLLGLTVLRKKPGQLFMLGYGIEGPLMLMLAVRFFVVREMTPGVALLLSIAGLGMAAFLWQILDRDIDSRGPLLTRLRLLGLTLFLLTSLYVGVWIAFYALPLGFYGWRALGEVLRDLPQFMDDLWRGLVDLFANQWRWFPVTILGLILALYTATLFILMPIAVPLLSVRAWLRGVRALVAQVDVPRFGWLVAGAITTVTLVICVALFAVANQQPQQRAFSLLETPPTNTAEAQTLLDQESVIRAGLLNAYLAPQRYISVVGEMRHIREMYTSILRWPVHRAERAQRLYEFLARPVLYEPAQASAGMTSRSRQNGQRLREERLKAAHLYESFFDRTIQEGEHEAVVHAVRSTWSIEQAETGWMAVDDREVYLARQEITITEHGDRATGELYEVYQNQTAQRQEVVYYFSLPESSVITGVWLGNSPDRDQRFAYRVSPRGAAQAIYRNEVRRNYDPALLEQIGPRQYRLRIFPVERMHMVWDEGEQRTSVEDGPALHMWLTWSMLARDSAWPLPRLAEQRNVFWDAASARLINGQPMAADVERWLPTSVPATSPVQPVVHRIDFPNGETVLARPVTAADIPAAAGDLRLAVVVDRSRSMAGRADDLQTALARLAEMADAGASIDVYLTASPYRGEEPALVDLATLDPDSILYRGGQNAGELLVQYDALRADRVVDAVFVLTDGTGFTLGGADVAIPISDVPIWMVHLGGDIPLGYDDATLDAIQASGGGAVSNIEDALARVTAARSADRNNSLAGTSHDIVDGYLWFTVSTADLASHMQSTAVSPTTDGFAVFAARRLILAAMHRHRAELDQLETLDQLHAIAVRQSIVTPLSSMIVLVNARQERLLNRLEDQGDRFEREAEDIGETLPESASLTGVPEPQEWLLLTLAAAMLMWFIYSTRRDQWSRFA